MPEEMENPSTCLRFTQQALDNIAEHMPDSGSSLLLPLKRGQMLPLIKQILLEKLLPKQWGLQGMLRLSYAVDLLADANSTERTGRDRI